MGKHSKRSSDGAAFRAVSIKLFGERRGAKQNKKKARFDGQTGLDKHFLIGPNWAPLHSIGGLRLSGHDFAEVGNMLKPRMLKLRWQVKKGQIKNSRDLTRIGRKVTYGIKLCQQDLIYCIS